MAAEEPPHNHQFVDLVLAVLAHDLLIVVVDVIHSFWFFLHLFEVEADLRRDAFQVFRIQVDPVAEAFDGSLERGEVYLVEAQEAFRHVAFLFFAWHAGQTFCVDIA